MPVTIGSTDIIKLINPGDRITLILADSMDRTTTLFPHIRVVTVPAATTSGGFVAATNSPNYILVEVSIDEVALLAAASASGFISVALE
jgi:Flp pilus assembly protein CpaB